MPSGDLADILVPPHKRNLAGDIVNRLRDAIYNGQLAPNERLREEVLASVLGLSRGPVREALAQLEREGLVIRQPNRSATVARLSLDDVEEVYSLRLALEQLAAKQAIQHGETRYFDEMQKVVNDMGECVVRGITTQEAATLDTRFHELIYEASQHKRLLNIWSTLRPQIYIFLLSRNVANPDFGQYLVPGHQRLLDLLRSHDEAGALTALQDHLRVAYERILKSYADHLSANQSKTSAPLNPPQ